MHGDGPQNNSDIYYYYTGNRRNSFGYDAAGNVTNDGTQSFAYDATRQQTYASGLGAGGSAPPFSDDPLNPNGTKTDIKLVHLTELRTAVNQLRVRAGLSQVTNWNPDPNPQQYVTPVHHDHITQLRTKLEEALNALHLPVGSYAHAGPNQGDTIYAIDFQELRNKIKDAWTALSSSGLSQSYDGDGLRVKKTEYGWTTWYLRSSVLGGQVIAELDAGGNWARGYVYAGNNLMAVQQGGVFWMHEDPVTKSKRTTDVNGNVVSAIELDPWGADTNRSSYAAFQPRKFTTYNRDGNGSDEAMFRRYNRKNSRFDQPDPYEGSYDLTDPQSFNRYAYTKNDPVNFRDPSGLDTCYPDPATGQTVCVPDIVATVTVTAPSNSGPIIGNSILGGDDMFRLEELSGEGGSGGGGGGGGVHEAGHSAQVTCDQVLAGIFGGPGAVVSSRVEPNGLLNANGTPSARAGMDRGDFGHSATPRNDLANTNDRGGIIHIYANPQGLPGTTGLYVPPDFRQYYPAKPGSNNQRYFINDNNITIVFTHVATSGVTLGDRNAYGSSRIGNIGGPGGDGKDYFHTHITFYSEYFGNPYTGTRTDPRKIFCR